MPNLTTFLQGLPVDKVVLVLAACLATVTLATAAQLGAMIFPEPEVDE